MGQTLFSWIHLSDIHFCHGEADTREEQTHVLGLLCRDVQESIAKGAPRPNAILVTGDIAFSGDALGREEYARATEWLLKVGEAAGGVDAKNIFVVPGNHDVNRKAGSDDKDCVRMLKALRDGGELLDEALANARDSERLIKRQEGYLAFAAGMAPACREGGGGRVFWVHTIEAQEGLRVRLVGLNTALLSGGDDDKGKLRLGAKQRGLVLGAGPSELVVVLSHHPFSGGWLADEREADGWVKNHAHLHLSGHIHDADSARWLGGGGGDRVRVVAGAAHGDKPPPGAKPDHGYSFGVVVCGDDGSLVLRIWPRRWSDKHKIFRVDGDNVPDGRSYAEHGLRLRLPISDARRVALAGPVAVRPAHMAVRAEATVGVRFEGPGAAPAGRIAHFLGRDDELKELRAALEESSGAVCVVATGVGGIGKTALVQQFVATEAEKLFPEGVAWIDAMALASEVARVAQRFGWAQDRQPTLEEAKAWIARALHDRQVLLVIDNVDPERVDPNTLPIAAGRSRTVLTSRTLTLHEMLGREARPLPLARWSKEACREYLREVVPGLREASDADLDALADFVGALPLAVRLLARLLLRPGASPRAVLGRLKDKPIEMLEKVATGADRGIAKTFQESFDHLDERRRRVLIALASCAPATRANVVAGVAGMPEADAEDLLSDLAERSFVEHTPGERPWSLHDVVRLFARCQDGVAEADASHLQFAQTHVDEHDDATDWQAMESELPEVLAVVDRLLAARKGKDAWNLLGRATDHLTQRGRHTELIEPYQHLLALLPADNAVRAAVLGNLGICYRHLGDISRAIDCHQRSLAIEEKLGHLEGQAINLGNLGLCYQILGDIPKAVDYLQRSLEIYERLGQLEGQASNLVSLGLCYRILGDIPKAIDYQERALAINEQLGRLEGKAIALGNLGLCYQILGDIPKAIDYHQRALAINKQLGRLVGEAITLGNLGLCYQTLGDIPKAMDYLQCSLVIDEQLGRLEGQASNLANLGSTYRFRGDIPKAVDHFQRSLILFRRMGLPDTHPHIQLVLSALAKLGR